MLYRSDDIMMCAATTFDWPSIQNNCGLSYLCVCSLTFKGVTGGLEWASFASLKDMLETEAGGLDILLGVARPEKEGVRLQMPPEPQL